MKVRNVQKGQIFITDRGIFYLERRNSDRCRRIMDLIYGGHAFMSLDENCVVIDKEKYKKSMMGFHQKLAEKYSL